MGHDVKNPVSFSHIHPKLPYPLYHYFPPINFFHLSTHQNHQILPLLPFPNTLLIFSPYSISPLYPKTTSHYQFLKINTPTPSIPPHTIQLLPNQIFYFTHTHLYPLFPNHFNILTPQIITNQIQSTIPPIPLTQKTKPLPRYFQPNYYLSFPNPKTLLYHQFLPSSTLYSNIKPHLFLTYHPNFYFPTNTNPYLFHPQYHHHPNPIPFPIQTNYFHFPFITQHKNIHPISFHTNQPNPYPLPLKLHFQTNHLQPTTPNPPNLSNSHHPISHHHTFHTIQIYINPLPLTNPTKKIPLIIHHLTHIPPFLLYPIPLHYQSKTTNHTTYPTNSNKI